MFQLKYFDWHLFFALFIIAIFSLLSLASFGNAFFYKQIIWYVISFIIIILSSQINWMWLKNQVWFRQFLYWFSVALLLFSQFQTSVIRGTKSWIVIGSFQFEPVEIAKIALIFMLASFFSKKYFVVWHFKNIVVSFLYVILPVGLTIIHPDFGSAFVLFIIWFGFVALSGVNKKRFFTSLFLGAIVAVLMWTYFLKPYQKDRLTSFIFPERDPLGASYNVIQSKIAIGSAGWLGKGFGQGTQTQLHFLPEAQTDFLFAAFIEEWGIIGGLALVLTFAFATFRIINIGLRAHNNDSKFMVLGSSLVFLAYFFINTGSNLGLTPVTGVNFPFFSYGGSNLLTTATLIGIIERIRFESR